MDRRTFLATSGGLALTSALGNRASVASAAIQAGRPVSQTAAATGNQPVIPDQSPQKKIGYAIVGLGKFAVGQILPSFAQAQHSRVTGFVSGDAAKAAAFAKAYNVSSDNIYDYNNYDRIIDNPDIDAVFIILPNALHAEFTVRALQAGKHVLCEKPMATSVADCERMIAAAQTANRKLMIAYRMHYEPFNRTMMSWSRERKFGAVQMVMCDTLMDVGGAPQWRLDPVLSGGGSLIDVGIYSLNAARYLTGEEPVVVQAMAHRDPHDARFSQVEQSIIFQLRFPSGALANCSSSYSCASVSRFRVVAAEGWYALEPAQSYSGLRMQMGQGGNVSPVHLQEVNQFAAEMDHFAECIIHDHTPRTPGEEGLKDLALIKKIYAAAG